MRRLLAFFGGILSGGAIGTAAALLFTPASGDEMRTEIKTRYEHALEAGRHAAAEKRLEMEAQLAEMTNAPRQS